MVKKSNFKAKSLHIKGAKYKIKVENIWDKRLQGADGLCNKTSKIIYIHSSLSNAEKNRVLIHEVMHAIIHETAIDEAVGRGTEEIICENVAQVLCELFF